MKLRGVGTSENGERAVCRTGARADRGELARFFHAGSLLLALCAAPACGKDAQEAPRPPAQASASVAVPGPGAIRTGRTLTQEEQSALDEQLRGAVYWGREDLIPGLISKGVNPNSKNPAGDTLLACSIVWRRGEPYVFDKGGTYRVMEALLENGADPNLAGGKFISAASFRCRHVVDLFIRHGMDPNRQDYEGRSALMAVMGRNPAYSQQHAWNIFCEYSDFPGQLVESLLDAGADVNLRNKSGQSALAILSEQEFPSVRMGKLLIEHGADVNNVDILGRTPLYTARSGQFVQLLVENGADVNARDRDGVSPLMVHSGCAALLLRAGADPLAVDKSGRSVPHHYIGRNSDLEALRAVLEAGANVEARESGGARTLLLSAANHRDVRAIELLLSLGASMNARNDEGLDVLSILRRDREATAHSLAHQTRGPVPSTREALLREALYDIDAALDVLKRHQGRTPSPPR